MEILDCLERLTFLAENLECCISKILTAVIAEVNISE